MKGNSVLAPDESWLWDHSWEEQSGSGTSCKMPSQTESLLSLSSSYTSATLNVLIAQHSPKKSCSIHTSLLSRVTWGTWRDSTNDLKRKVQCSLASIESYHWMSLGSENTLREEESCCRTSCPTPRRNPHLPSNGSSFTSPHQSVWWSQTRSTPSCGDRGPGVIRG